MRKINRLVGVILCSMMFHAATTVADDHDDDLDQTGKIDVVNLEERRIVVGDLLYRLPVDLKIYGVRGASETDYALKPGVEIRYQLEDENPRSGYPNISEIWILDR